MQQQPDYRKIPTSQILTINQNIKNILEDGELMEKSVIKKYLITASDGELPENPTIRNFRIVQTNGSRQLLRNT